MERVGKSESDLLEYLSGHPRSRNIDISTALNEDKANVSNRLKRLKKKELVEEKSDKWSLTEKGIMHLIGLGGDIQTIIKNYWYTQSWVKTLKIVDEILTNELSFWPQDRNQVFSQLYLSLDAISKAGVTDETVLQYSIMGVFKSYTDKKIKTKQMKKKQMVKIGKKLVAVLGGLKNTLKIANFDYGF